MFEDSTFASTNRIQMRSRAGFLWAALLESAVVLAVIAMSLLYPRSLPSLANPFVVQAPTEPVSEAAPQVRPAAVQARAAVLVFNPFQAPRVIPRGAYIPDKPEGPAIIDPSGLEDPKGSGEGPFGPAKIVAVAQFPAPRVVRLPSTVSEGMLVQKTDPVYPQIAIDMHSQGTVVLQATISRDGTIEDLRAISGPPMLRQAALNAVSTWRYRPYMLNGQPIPVETTVDVVFKLN